MGLPGSGHEDLACMTDVSDGVMKLMEEAARARRESRLADARRDYAEAVDLSRRSGSDRDLAQALKGLGQIEREMGHGERARLLYEEAVAICRREGDALVLAHTVRHLGDLHLDEGRPDLAEPCFREALALYRNDASSPPLDLANALRPFAILKENLGQRDEAKRLWEEARDLYATVGVQVAVAECSRRLARLT